MWIPYNKTAAYYETNNSNISPLDRENIQNWNGRNDWYDDQRMKQLAVENPNKYWWNRSLDIQMPYNTNRYEDDELEYWKSKYPKKIQRIQEYVSGACDKIDYSTSALYDEVPDWIYLKRIANNILQMVLEDEDFIEEDMNKGQITEEMALQGEAIKKNTCRGKNCSNHWLTDIIEVLLFNEVYRRRCNHGCNHRYNHRYDHSSYRGKFY